MSGNDWILDDVIELYFDIINCTILNKSKLNVYNCL